MLDEISLEGFSFTASEGEAAAIYFMLKAEGLEPNSQGVKDFLLRTAGVTPGGTEEEPEDSDENDLSEKVRRIIDAAERNPEVTQYAIKKGAQLLGTLLKRLG